MKILVADDHQMIVNGLILDLNSLVPDAEVTGTSSSKEVMDLCKENRYDIVFMDIDMPGTDGISMAKKILAKYPRTNIIYITGYEKYALDSYETNASTFILKPITTKKIKAALDNLRFPVSRITDEMIASQSAGDAVIGRKIQKCREERGITRNQLSELMGVSVPTVHRWENGTRVPDVVTFMRLANILGVSPNELMD